MPSALRRLDQPVIIVILVALASLALVILALLLWTLLVRGFFRSAACPHCGSSRIRPSEMPMRGDWWRAWFSLSPYRCLGCGVRFYNARWSRLPRAGEPSA
ncbi:MAG: hypothetical protein HYR60_02240 [Acidobacteria bacterium]|nr:hypothetical protein [Acidobacteriota bacterium]MBI3470442.1 hypothetical protein [Candidatus Solibacter usitatus]